MTERNLFGAAPTEPWMAEQHQRALSLPSSAMGRPTTLVQALLDCCAAWPDQADAEYWRNLIAVEDYMSARDQIASTAAAVQS